MICKLGAVRGARPALEPEAVRCLEDAAVKSSPAEHLADKFSGAVYLLLPVRSSKSVGPECDTSLVGTVGAVGMSLGFPKICPVFAYIPWVWQSIGVGM